MQHLQRTQVQPLASGGPLADGNGALSGEALVEAFARLTQVVAEGATLDETLDFVYETFQGIIPFERLGCAMLDSSGERVVNRWCRTSRSIRLGNGFSAPLAGSSLQLVLQRRCPRILNDLQSYLRKRPESHATMLIVREGYRSSLTCPLIVENHGIGFLFFTSIKANSYSGEHVKVFQKIAGLLSLNILVSTERERSMAERDRSTAILDGCIDLLTDLVGRTQPEAKVSARRAEWLVDQMVEEMGLSDTVNLIRAARLCRIGWITVPAQSLHSDGFHASREMPNRLSLSSRMALTSELVSRIPDLEIPAEMIALHEQPYSALRSRYGDIQGYRPALGAAMLRLVLDFDALRLRGWTNLRALQRIRNTPKTYAPFLVDVLEKIVSAELQPILKKVSLDKLRDGMLLEDHIVSKSGNVLISSGRIVDEALRQQIRRFVQLGNSIREPLAISILPAADDQCVDDITDVVGFENETALSGGV